MHTEGGECADSWACGVTSPSLYVDVKGDVTSPLAQMVPHMWIPVRIFVSSWIFPRNTVVIMSWNVAADLKNLVHTITECCVIRWVKWSHLCKLGVKLGHIVITCLWGKISTLYFIPLNERITFFYLKLWKQTREGLKGGSIFLCRTSGQLICLKNGWSLMGSASKGPAPSLWDTCLC